MNEMSRQSDRSTEGLQRLSELMDGELQSPNAIGDACTGWRDDAGLRASWHAWHVIGDVMRSDDLVRDARGDAAFLAGLRARLQDEPVVLAPQPLAVPPAVARAPRRGWSAAAAIAAGLAVVVGAGVLMQQPNAPAPQLAAATPPTTRSPIPEQGPVVAVAPVPVMPGGALQQVVASNPTDPQVLTVDGELIRDARLDRYLAAHKPFSANPALAVQSSFAGAVRSRQTDR